MGIHMGMTPFGYVRVYPEHVGGHRAAGVLVPHEPEASVVREMFARYAGGGWSTRQLAEDLNRRGITGARGKPWSTGTVGGVLANVTYAGDVGFNRRPSGHYLQAKEGNAFVAEGKHEALVSRETFDLVQRRLADARTYRAVARRTAHAHALAGLLRCDVCGGLMVANLGKDGRHGQMRCANRHKGREGCTGSAYRLDLATDALLAEIKRLRGSRWTSDAEERLAGDSAGVVAALTQELDARRAKLKRAMAGFALLDDQGPEDLAAINAVRAELGAEIRVLEAQLAEVSADAAALPRLRALHARLRQTEIPDLVDRLRGHGDDVGLRDLVTGLVTSGVVVERHPERRSAWLRVEVAWQDDVQTLLDAGLLTLAPPARPAERERVRERQARFRARRREGANIGA